MGGGVRALAGLLLLAGCAGTETVEEGRSPVIPAGWGRVVFDRPDDVLTMLKADEAGWVALHRGELGTAMGASEPVAARARRELHATEAVLLDLQTFAAVDLAQSWAGRAGLPQGSALHVWAALAAADGGHPTAELLALAPAPEAADWAALHRALSAPSTELATLAEQTPGELGDCLKAHARSRTEGAALPDGACPSSLLVEADGARTLADPLAMRTRHLARSEDALNEQALSSLLFSAAWTAADLGAPAQGPTALSLGLGTADSPDAALAQVQSATSTLDGWRPDDQAPGARLAADLDVIGVYRAHLLTDWALDRVSTPAAAHEAFRALLDADAGRDLGPTHPPRMLAAEALTAVQAGHVRSALPSLRALEPLSPVLHELPALTELVNDLQVAATLGRSGDSKEP